MITLRRRILAVVASAVLVALLPVAASAHTSCGDPCCQTCCAPPPPVAVTLCLQDPCTLCTVEAELCVPAACAGEAPQVSWRRGLFGRRIAELCWSCCDYTAEVVITRHGRIIVR